MSRKILAASLAALCATGVAGGAQPPPQQGTISEGPAGETPEQRWQRLQAESARIQAERRAAQLRYEQEVRDAEAARVRFEAEQRAHDAEVARIEAEARAAQEDYQRRLADYQRRRAEYDARHGRDEAAPEAPAPVATRGAAEGASASAEAADRCEERQQRNRRRGRAIGGVLGGIAGATVGRGTVGRLATAALSAPVGALIGDAIARLLDCDEQRQAAAATEEAVRGATVGTTASWTSETRPGVTGSSTVTAVEQVTDAGPPCMTVTDIVIVDGEETRAPKRMCRRPPTNRYVRV